MSWMYPRTVTIKRSKAPAGVGLQPYSGRQPDTETLVLADVPANIQANTVSKDPLGGMPASSVGRGQWKIFLPTVTRGVLLQNDILIDDTGIRYNVTQPYWNGFQYVAFAETLKT